MEENGMCIADAQFAGEFASISMESDASWKDGPWKKDFGLLGSIVYSEPENNIAMNRRPSQSTVDRLIALATEETPVEPKHPEQARPGNQAALPMLGDAGLELEPNSLGKALMQFRVLLPYVSQLMEMTQAGPSAALTAELKQSMGDLANVQRELRMAVQEQVLQMKHLEEEVSRTRTLTERSMSENLEVVEDVRSVQSTVKFAAIGIGALLAVLIGLVIWLLARGSHG